MVRVVDTRIEVGRHFIVSSHNIQGNEWGSDSGSNCKYR